MDEELNMDGSRRKYDMFSPDGLTRAHEEIVTIETSTTGDLSVEQLATLYNYINILGRTGPAGESEEDNMMRKLNEIRDNLKG